MENAKLLNSTKLRVIGIFIAQITYTYEEPINAVLRLHLNECLYGVPEAVANAIAKYLDRFNLYPSKTLFDRFRELLAEYSRVDKEEVYPFAGADSALRTVFLLLAKPHDKVLHVDPTFMMIYVFISNLGLNSVSVSSYEEGEWWKINIDGLIEKSRNADLVVLVDPNNPTGGPIIKADKGCIDAIARNTKGYLVFDETYFEFADYSVVKYVNDVPKLIVVRSMSKSFCLAGFRLGYIIAEKNIIKKLTSIYTPFDIPTPSLVAGIAALENRGYMERYITEIKSLRERFFWDLKRLGFKVFRSYTNFLVVRDRRPLDEILSKRGIYIKKFGEDLYRITIPPPDFYDKIIKVLVEAYENSYTE